MATTIKSPGFGPTIWHDVGQPASLPMGMSWNNNSSFEIGELNTFSVNLNIGAVSSGIKTRGWDYSITIENNTDPTNVYLSNNTGTFSASGTNTFILHFNTDTFLAPGQVINQPSDSEMKNKFGPVHAGDSDPYRYTTLLRSTGQPTAYRNILAETIIPATETTYPRNFDTILPENNKFAILLKIVRTNATAPAINIVDYRVFFITFTPLVDIQ